MERLRKAWGLSTAEWLALWQAWACFLVIDLGLRTFSLRSLLTFVQGRDGDLIAHRRMLPLPVPRLAALVAIAGRYHFIRTTCLKEACVLSLLLRLKGERSLLRIGVARSAGAFTAHAWLEYGGQVVLGLRQPEDCEPIL